MGKKVRRWRGKLADEESNVSGSAPALGRHRVRLAPDMSRIPPACGRIFQLSPRGRELVPPRASALPETMALPRLL